MIALIERHIGKDEKMNPLNNPKFYLKAGMEFMSKAEMGDLHIVVLRDESEDPTIQAQDLPTKKEMTMSLSNLKENFIYTACPANLTFLRAYIRQEGVEPCSSTDKIALLNQLYRLWVSY